MPLAEVAIDGGAMAAVTVSLEWLLAQHDLGLRLVAGYRGASG